MNGECDKCGEHVLDCNHGERIKITYSNMSTRAVNILKSQGIEYADQVATLSIEDLMRMPFFGEKTLRDVKEFLRGNGLCLKDEPEDFSGVLDNIQTQLDMTMRNLRYFRSNLHQIIKTMRKK